MEPLREAMLTRGFSNPVDESTIIRMYRKGKALHIIRKHVYDFSSFAKHHPGGEDILGFFEGLDVTGFFQVPGEHMSLAVIRHMQSFCVGPLGKRLEEGAPESKIAAIMTRKAVYLHNTIAHLHRHKCSSAEKLLYLLQAHTQFAGKHLPGIWESANFEARFQAPRYAALGEQLKTNYKECASLKAACCSKKCRFDLQSDSHRRTHNTLKKLINRDLYLLEEIIDFSLKFLPGSQTKDQTKKVYLNGLRKLILKWLQDQSFLLMPVNL